ncbi:hypothetical protein BDQ17DRAFT_1246001, partial [Cyathus striatus]
LTWIQFRFDGSEVSKTRRDALFKTLHSNQKAMFVTQTVKFRSEPLFGWAIDPSELAEKVAYAKSRLSALQMPITLCVTPARCSSGNKCFLD